MKTIASVAVLLLAGAAHAQTPPAQTPPGQTPSPAPASPANDLTRDLNSGPPAPAVYLAPAPAPAPAAPAVSPGATPAPPPAATITPAPRPATPATPAPATAPPARSVAPTPVLPPSEPVTPPPGGMTPRLTPIPTNPAPQPRMAPITPPRSALPSPVLPPSAPFTPPAVTPAPAPTVPLEAVVEPAPAPAPAAPAVTVLDSAARAALPFSADLPPGFEIVTGRPGPDFRIYTIRRAGQSFVMIYAGPASQFPIYTGQMVEAGGRASIVATEDGERHAMEHLFQRPTAPQEVHVWTMSLDGADRAMAEQIAQSVDVR